SLPEVHRREVMQVRQTDIRIVQKWAVQLATACSLPRRKACLGCIMTDWDQCYQQGATPWDKGEPSPPLEAWLAGHRLSGRALVPGCGLGHDLARVTAAGIDATGLDIAPTAVKRARAAYPQLADRFVLGDLFAPPAEW